MRCLVKIGDELWWISLSKILLYYWSTIHRGNKSPVMPILDSLAFRVECPPPPQYPYIIITSAMENYEIMSRNISCDAVRPGYLQFEYTVRCVNYQVTRKKIWYIAHIQIRNWRYIYSRNTCKFDCVHFSAFTSMPTSINAPSLKCRPIRWHNYSQFYMK